MNERYLRWFTPHLSRDFEMLVFGNGGGLLLILFPNSFGNFRQCHDENIYFNSPCQYLPNMPDTWKFNRAPGRLAGTCLSAQAST